MPTAVLVDGGFYRKRANELWGKKSPEDRADELNKYVFKHINDKMDGPRPRELYRIFYYDCPPVQSVVYHPFLKKNVELGKSETYQWTLDFFESLKEKRKMALRLGRLSEAKPHFDLNPNKVKKLCNGSLKVKDLKEKDFAINLTQKGVDMKMGIDIASLAYEGIVPQIILISGDSDFVPAAKLARRKGIDFILDPMGNDISSDLFEHIDGKESFIDVDPQKPPKKEASKKDKGSKD